MDPQSQFKERYEKFIKTRQAQIQKSMKPLSKPRHPFNKYYVLGLLLGIFIIAPAIFSVLILNDPITQTPAENEQQISDETDPFVSITLTPNPSISLSETITLTPGAGTHTPTPTPNPTNTPTLTPTKSPTPTLTPTPTKTPTPTLSPTPTLTSTPTPTQTPTPTATTTPSPTSTIIPTPTYPQQRPTIPPTGSVTQTIGLVGIVILTILGGAFLFIL